MTDAIDPVSGSESQITLTRTIEADVADVFSAFTDPALIEQWLADEADVDLVEGGSFRLVTYDEDETTQAVSGNFRTIEEDRRLVMSWIVGEGEDESVFLLEIGFAEIEDGSTRLTIVERGTAHADAETRIFSIEAWNAAIAHLAELMA